VTHSSSLATTKPTARKALAQMARPDGWSRTTWRSVSEMLDVIVGFYPRACPSQVRIASIMGASERSVKSWVALAKAADLLYVQPNVGAKPKRRMGHHTNRYLIILPPSMAEKRAETARHEYSYGVSKKTSSPLTTSEVPKSARPSGSLYTNPTPTTPRGDNVVHMKDRWNDDRSRQVDAEEETPAVVLKFKGPQWPTVDETRGMVGKHDSGTKAKKRVLKPDRYRRLTDHFITNWNLMVLDTQLFKDVRPIETIKQCRPYLKAHFDNHEEPEVRKMMEEFIHAVRKRDVVIKEGQSAWMCFTGAWGRQRHMPKADPYAIYKEQK